MDLWLFTIRFPYGAGEAFIEPELEVLSRRFERIVIVPLHKEASIRPLPANVEVFDMPVDPYAPASMMELARYAGILGSLGRSIRYSAPDGKAFAAQRTESRAAIRQCLARALALKRTLFHRYDPTRVVLYTYWLYDQAVVLGLLKRMDPRIRFVSRASGFDLYEDRSPYGWFPFRAFQLAQVDRVFAASQAGLDHLRARHPEHQAKFHLARLGTRDHGPGPWSPSKVLRVASCSRLVELKRVPLLAGVLRKVAIPVEWTHFGDGPERDNVEALVASMPSSVHAALAGAVPNAEVMAWYRAHPVDLFIHLGESEGGVPVALQEAASFGIPLMACDAGGVREIVDERTGILLPLDPLPRQIVQLLEEFPAGHRDTAAFRAGVRERWSAEFRAEANFGRFAEELIGPERR